MKDVTALLARGRRAGPDVDPLAAIMGEDWAELKLGHPQRCLQIDGLLRQEMRRTARDPMLGSRVVRREPQAMVKLVAGGGATSAKGLRDQMMYLSRKGEVALTRSESFFGLSIDEAEVRNIERAWGLTHAHGQTERTSHFVVSFPEGTDRDAAERAGRAWAEEMFESGRFGDQWDYYTAYHRDTAYPHMHVVVARRGVDRGDWLKVSNREALTFDALREVQVEVAAREGIALEASPRLARGLHARPVPDAEYRRAEAERRVPVAPAHNEVSAAVSAAAVLSYARRYAEEAAHVAARQPALAEELRHAAELLEHGHGLAEGRAADPTDMRAAMLASFRDMDAGLLDVSDPVERASIRRDIAELKRDAAHLMPEVDALQPYRQASTAYAGLGAIVGAEATRIAEAAHAQVAEITREAGMNGQAMLLRYGQGGVSEGLARDFEQDEIAELRAQTRLRYPKDIYLRKLSDLHTRLSDVYSQAVARIQELPHGRSRDDDGFGF